MKGNKLVIWVVNYLDDFLFIQTTVINCNRAIKEFLELCDWLGIKIVVEKTEWGTTKIVFLGILLDGDNLILTIPEDKRLRAINMLELVINKKKATLKELQRLAGYLNFLTRAIFPGRMFTRRMYSKFADKQRFLKPYHHIRLDQEFKQDCGMWLEFLEQQEVRSNIYRSMVDLGNPMTNEQIDFYSDASGSKTKGGFGCVYNNMWSFGQWNEKFMKEKQPSIEYLELAALTIAIFTWTKNLQNKRFVVFCDNQAVVEMVNKCVSSCKNCMVLLRKLVLRQMKWNFRVFVKFVRTQDNGVADALSRQNWKRFAKLTVGKNMNKKPEVLPHELWPIEKLWIDN